jgi:hypothetical protein
MSTPILDALTYLPISRQRKYQLRMQRQGRCTVCGKPAARGSRALCLKHLLNSRESRRRAKRNGRVPNTDARKPDLKVNGGNPGAPTVKSSPVKFTYQTKGIEVTAAMAGDKNMTRVGLTSLMQTFLTMLTWVCSTNCSSPEGWLTLTLSEQQSLWRVTGRGASGRSSLRLVPVSGKRPAVLRGATKWFAG